MGDALKKVRAGQPLHPPAATWNTFIDAARDFLNRSQGIARSPVARAPADTGLVLVRNDSGATVNRFGILGVDSIVISPTANLDEFKNHPVLSVVAPVVPDHSENFVILTEPLAHQAAAADRTIGSAVIDGLAVVQVDVQNADHEFAVLVNAQSTKLKSAVSGPAQIIYKESGTGDKWAVVRLGGRTLPDGTADNDILYWDNTNHKWVVLSSPAEDSKAYALVRKADHSLGWVEITTFTCP